MSEASEYVWFKAYSVIHFDCIEQSEIMFVMLMLIIGDAERQSHWYTQCVRGSLLELRLLIGFDSIDNHFDDFVGKGHWTRRLDEFTQKRCKLIISFWRLVYTLFACLRCEIEQTTFGCYWAIFCDLKLLAGILILILIHVTVSASTFDYPSAYQSNGQWIDCRPNVIFC